MFYTIKHFTSAIGLLIVASLDFSAAQIGVCYGRNGNDLPSPSDTVALLQQNNIQRVRIYDPNQDVLRAFSGSNIEVMLGVPNDQLQNIATSQANADAWVQNNIRNIPNVRFKYLAVGNEVSPLRDDTSQYVPYVLPAMININNAVNGLNIRVSTAIETGLVTNSFPPENGVFRPDVTDYMGPIVGFLARSGAPLLVNVYPYFAYIFNKAQIDLQYALFTSDGVNAGGVQYQNLLYALVDSVYASLEKRGAPSIEIVVSESGWPTDGGDATSIENARIYNTNLIQRVGNGTPKRPGRAIETYIFALYDENQKNPEYEKHFGIFLSNRSLKYPISF